MPGATANESPSGLFVRTFEYPSGYEGNRHQHRLEQIIYPVRGIVSVDVSGEQIIASPYRAVAIPSWATHKVSARGNASLRSIFVDPLNPDVPHKPSGVLSISTLLHELVREAGYRYGRETKDIASQQILQLVATLLFQTPAADGYIQLPTVAHPRFKDLFTVSSTAVLHWSACEIADKLALSPRQFRRLFKTETGMTFSQWRAMARISAGIEQLSEGKSITTIADALSFSSSSAFTEVFKRYTGMTPSEFRHGQHSPR